MRRYGEPEEVACAKKKGYNSGVYARKTTQEMPGIMRSAGPLLPATIVMWLAMFLAESPVKVPQLGITWIALLSGSAQPAPHDDEIVPNDNRTPAGVQHGGSLSVRLVAARGMWYPEEREGPAHEVYAFGEEGRGLSNPGPLLRVTVGTEIEATIHNRIPGATLHLHGRPGEGAGDGAGEGGEERDTPHINLLYTR